MLTAMLLHMRMAMQLLARMVDTATSLIIALATVESLLLSPIVRTTAMITIAGQILRMMLTRVATRPVVVRMRLLSAVMSGPG